MNPNNRSWRWWLGSITKVFLISVVFALLAFVIASQFQGCSKQDSKSVGMTTAVVIPAAQLQGVKADEAYGQVNSAWLPVFYSSWRAELFKKGVTKWEGRFDCNKFAGKFVSDAQVEYYSANFHSWTKGQALALAVIYYSPQDSINRIKKGRNGAVGYTFLGPYFIAEGSFTTEWIGPNHAVVEAETESGTQRFEPQTGKIFTMTSEEVATIYFRGY